MAAQPKAPSVLEPERFAGRFPDIRAPGYLFGETGAQIINRAIVCFPEFSSRLRSFCLRVSGAVAPSAPFPAIACDIAAVLRAMARGGLSRNG
jgi:hypothetical protein